MVDKHNTKKIVLGVISVLVIIVGIYILAKYGVSTGKAIEMPEGFYWEEEPELNPWKVDEYLSCLNVNCKVECEKSQSPECSSCKGNKDLRKECFCGNKNSLKTLIISSGGSNSIKNYACCSETEENVCGLNGEDDPKNILKPMYHSCFKQNSFVPLELNKVKYSALCDFQQGGMNWVLCDKEELLSANKNFICKDKSWQVCDEKTKSTLALNDKYLCTGEEWLVCDKDSKDKVSPEGSYWCTGGKWSNEFNMGFDLKSGDGFYEVVVEKNKPAKVCAPFGKTELCDKNTENVASIATVCHKDTVPVNSVSKLASGNEKPKTYSLGELSWLYLYEKEEINKKVSIISLVDISGQKEVKLYLSTAAKNLINGQRVAVLLDGQYYLLSHPADKLFGLNSLKVTHIPTMKEFSAEKIPKNKVQFSVFAKKAIVVNIVQGGDNLVVTSAAPEEKAAAFVTPFKLSEEYEVPFDLENPAELTDLGRTITVCSNDKPADPLVLLVCLDDEYFFTLKKDVLTKVTIEDSKKNKQEAALLYQLVDEKKEAFVFLLKKLSKNDTNLAYSDFVDNIVGGKRVALEFENSLYLLGQNEGKILSLPATKLSLFNEGGSVSFQALGSEKKVEYLIPEGKVTLSRDFVQPPPPFKVSALTKLEVLDVPLNLNERLFSAMSSQIPINIQPDLGIIQKSDDDTVKNKDLFKVVSNLNSVGKKNLFFKQPLAIGSTLIYYFDAAFDGKDYIKMVKFYHFYDVTGSQKDHLFNNQFMDVFTGGNELALKFADSYYLLGYKGKNGFFSIKDLTLTTLEKQNMTLAETISTSATFNVPEGKIKITVDDPNNKIYFESVSSEILQTESFSSLNFSTVLTPDKRVEVESIPDAYYICDKGDIKYLKSHVYLCNGSSENKLTLGEEKFIVENNAPKFRYKYLGVISGKKTILFQSIFTLPVNFVQNFEWTKAAENLANGKSPLLKVENDYLELQGSEELDSFALVDKENKEYPIFMQSEEEAYENGTIVVNDEQIFFQKELVKDIIKLNVELLASKIIPEDGLTINNSGSFVAGVGGEKYELIVAENGLLLVTVKDSNGKNVFLGFMPPGSKKTILLADGNIVIIEVVDKSAVKIALTE